MQITWGGHCKEEPEAGRAGAGPRRGPSDGLSAARAAEEVLCPRPSKGGRPGRAVHRLSGNFKVPAWGVSTCSWVLRGVTKAEEFY